MSDRPSSLARLRADLMTARKARLTTEVATLRSTIAAIENAEAVQPVDVPADVDTPIAGSSAGLGVSETARRELSDDDVRHVVQAEIDERTTAAQQYETLHQDDQAAQLRDEISVLQRYL